MFSPNFLLILVKHPLVAQKHLSVGRPIHIFLVQYILTDIEWMLFVGKKDIVFVEDYKVDILSAEMNCFE